MPTSRAGRVTEQAGFAYPLVIVAACVMGILAGVASTSISQTVQRDREEELLYRGQAYMNAIRRYYEAEPDARLRVLPRTLEDLLQDPRFPNRRHLARLHADPFAPAGELGWRLITGMDGGIAGVASQSAQEPLRKTGFPPQLAALEGASSYQDWIFQFDPAQVATGARDK